MFLLFLLVPAAVAVACFALVGKTSLHMAWKTPLILLGSFFAIATAVEMLLFVFLDRARSPSMEELAGQFAARRGTLEQIGGMARQDREYSRINRAYVTFAATGKTESARKAFIPDRWRLYRARFGAASLKDGLAQDAAGNLFFIAGGEGLIHRGHTTGYVYCVEPGAPASAHSPFVPCRTAHQALGSQPYDVMKNAGGYHFRALADHWFVLDQDHS